MKGVSNMSKNLTIPLGVSWLLPLFIALTALFVWASVAQAQTEAQTYAPVDTSVAASDTSAGSGGAVGNSGAAASESAGSGTSARSSGDASAGSSGSAENSSLGIGVLPSTGGPLLPLIGLSAVALGATGLLVRQRHIRR